MDPDSSADYKQSREIVESGYEFLYETLNPSIHTEPMPKHAGDELYSILDMFRALEFSAKDIGKTTQEMSVEFEGFDGNHDGHHYRLSIFVRRTQGKWSELSHYPDNSHSQASLPRYRKMLKAWKGMGKPHKLTEKQIEELRG